MLHQMDRQNGKSHSKVFCGLLNKSIILVTTARKRILCLRTSEVYLLSYSCNKYILIDYYVPDSVLGSGQAQEVNTLPIIRKLVI